MSKPWTYHDPDGDRLHLSECKFGLHVVAESFRHAVPVCIPVADVPEVTAEMHKAAGLPDRWAELKRYLEGIRSKAAEHAADTALPERARFEQDTQARSMEFVLAAMAAMEAGEQ